MEESTTEVLEFDAGILNSTQLLGKSLEFDKAWNDPMGIENFNISPVAPPIHPLAVLIVLGQNIN